MVDKLVLVGPSADVKNFNRQYFLDKKSEGYKILCYGDVALYLKSIDIYPDNFMFADPNTLSNIMGLIKSGFFSQTNIIHADFYGNDLQDFFRLGYTCNSLKSKKSQYNEVLSVLSNLSNFFRKNISLPYTFIKTPPKGNIDVTFHDSLKLFSVTNRSNMCKLSYFVFPTLFYYFNGVNEIKMIGFGHYNMSRATSNSKRGYKEYINSFAFIKQSILTHLQNKGIILTLDGSPSTYDVLTTNNLKINEI